MKKRDIIDSITKKGLSPTAETVLESFFSFLGYYEHHEKVNFKQKLSSGMLDFMSFLKGINTSKVNNEDYLKARRTIRNVDQSALNEESPVIQGVFLWLMDALEISPLVHPEEESKAEGVAMEKQSEQPVSQRLDKEESCEV